MTEETQTPVSEDEGIVIPNEEKQFALPDDVENVLQVLLQEAAKSKDMEEFVKTKLPNQICDEFKEDWDSSSKWRENRAERRKLFLGALEEKKEPFKNCANVHIPIICEKVLRVAHRIVSEIYPSNEPIWSAITPSEDPREKQRVENITLFDNWQFTKECPQFRAQLLKSVTTFLLDGEVVWHSYYDFLKRRNVHEPLMVGEEFIFPFTWKTETLDMSDVPRKVKILRKYAREIRALEKSGFYLNTDKILKKGEASNDNEISDENIVQEVVSRFEGSDKSESKKDAPYVFLEYHGWATIPGIEDDTPVIVTMEYATKTIVNIRLREYEDPMDRARYDKQMAEYQMYLDDTQDYMEAMQLEGQVLEAAKQPHVDPEEAAIVMDQVMAQAPAPPQSPAWAEMDDQGMPLPAKAVKRIPLEQFSHGVCFPNPDGAYGLGLGVLLMPFQKNANVLMNQFIDSATLANSFTGFINEGLKLDPGVETVEPNKFHRVRGMEDISKFIYMMQTKPANGQLMEAAASQTAAADGVASAPDILSGEKEGAETFRGQATRVEQATKQLTIIAQGYVDVLGQVIRNNALLNFMFLEEEKLATVLDPRANQMVQVQVGREMYRSDYHLQFTADMRFASKAQKIAEKDDALGMLTKGFPADVLPMVSSPLILAESLRECLKARGMFNLLKHVKSDEDIMNALAMQAQQAQMAQQMMPPGPGGAPAPSIPTGGPPTTPGQAPQRQSVQPGRPPE